MDANVRLRRTAKWGGVLLCALMVALWVWSGWYWAGWVGADGLSAIVIRGRIEAHSANWWVPPLTGKGLGIGRGGAPYQWTVEASTRPKGQWRVLVPLWIPFLVVGLGTAVVWRRDAEMRRRVKFGLCLRCGYERGEMLLDRVCPECGTAGTRVWPRVPVIERWVIAARPLAEWVGCGRRCAALCAGFVAVGSAMVWGGGYEAGVARARAEAWQRNARWTVLLFASEKEAAAAGSDLRTDRVACPGAFGRLGEQGVTSLTMECLVERVVESRWFGVPRALEERSVYWVYASELAGVSRGLDTPATLAEGQKDVLKDAGVDERAAIECARALRPEDGAAIARCAGSDARFTRRVVVHAGQWAVGMRALGGLSLLAAAGVIALGWLCRVGRRTPGGGSAGGVG